MSYIKGVDVSHWEQSINWATMYSRGVRFEYSKATEGTTYTDSTYQPNNTEAKAQGILRGAFHFLRFDKSPEAQADYFWNVIKADPGELPPCVDFEANYSNGSVVSTPAGAVTILEKFITRLEQLCGRVPMIYTGLSFWLEHGSNNVKWARYPLWFAHPDETEPTKLPAPWTTYAIWQYAWTGDSAGDGWYYGASAAGLDMDRTTEAKLATLTGAEIPAGDDTVDWTKNALGYVTENAVWTTGLFQFIVAYAGGDWTKRAVDGALVLEPNPNLKAIETKARDENLPLFVLWDFDVAEYANNQIDANEASWPSEANDYPLKALISALSARDFDGLIIRVMNRKGFGDKEMMMNYVAFAAHKFVERVNKWLYTTKGLKKQTLVLTCDPFVRTDGAQESFYSWLKADWPPLVVEQATPSLVNNAYPATSATPGAVGNANWRSWYFWWSVKTAPVVDRNAGLMLYNGDAAALKAWLQVGSTGPVDPPVDPDPTDPDLEQRVKALETQLTALQSAYANHSHSATVGKAE